MFYRREFDPSLWKFLFSQKYDSYYMTEMWVNLSLAQSNDVLQPTTLVQKCAIPVDKFGFKKPIWKLNFYLLNKNFLFDVTSLPHQMTIYDCKKVPVFSSLARVLYRRFFFRIPLVKFDTFDPAKGTHWFSVFYYMIIKTNLP